MTTRPPTLLVLGYAPVVKRDVRVTPAAMTVDVGQLSLTPVSVELSAVAVTAPTLIAATIPAAGIAWLDWGARARIRRNWLIPDGNARPTVVRRLSSSWPQWCRARRRGTDQRR